MDFVSSEEKFQSVVLTNPNSDTFYVGIKFESREYV